MEETCGFKSKEMETEYYNSLYKMIFLIQQQFLELIKLIDKPLINHHLFAKHFRTLFNRLVTLDTKKKEAPLFSYSFHSLSEFYKENEQNNEQIYENTDNNLNLFKPKISNNEEIKIKHDNENDKQESKRKIKFHKKRKNSKNKKESLKLPEISGKEILFEKTLKRLKPRKSSKKKSIKNIKNKSGNDSGLLQKNNSQRKSLKKIKIKNSDELGSTSEYNESFEEPENEISNIEDKIFNTERRSQEIVPVTRLRLIAKNSPKRNFKLKLKQFSKNRIGSTEMRKVNKDKDKSSLQSSINQS